MKVPRVGIKSYVMGSWVEGSGEKILLRSAVDGTTVAEVSGLGIDVAGALDYARTKVGPKLRALSFHQRAMMLKELAKHLSDRKQGLYDLSTFTGATKSDSLLDIDGGLGTLYAYSSKARKELPNQSWHLDGDTEILSRNGSFVGRHIMLPLQGVAIHINAFNFPVWAMLEKFAPAFLAGVPSIVKPATVTAYVAFAMAREIVNSGIIPEGSFQFVAGHGSDLLGTVTCQDVVNFTGSQSTGLRLKALPGVSSNSVRFNMEADSLNCTVLGPDADPSSEEFSLFIDEIRKEMTIKAGQRCTAIRRIIVPKKYLDATLASIKTRMGSINVGNPTFSEVEMGPLVSSEQVQEVTASIELLKKNSEIILGKETSFQLHGSDTEKGSYLQPTVFFCSSPFLAEEVHSIEAFGPVSTVMAYEGIEEAIELAKKGGGSLVTSLFTNSDTVARDYVLGASSFHGRALIVNRSCAKESTGHGSPLPHLIHGGPGRAGGGEELGGVRSIYHYLQKTALQGSPTTLGAISGEYITGGEVREELVHPFRKYMDELQLGDSILTHRRTITEADIVNFAGVSGDFFYAHMDETAASESRFGRRVAHGYLVLAVAAGLFVYPGPCPVIANYGIEHLRFLKPVCAGDTLQVRLVCKSKNVKEGEDAGVVTWLVSVHNQSNEQVAIYDLLTLVQNHKPTAPV
jgi:oxepin-CoA hydrolase/3-oxo-5,6-dehydrosuberyl-CoA semialdehyde dehydrogenase